MKCNLVRTPLSDVLTAATGGVSPKTIPTSQAVHLKAADGELIVTTDDTETRITIPVPCGDIEEAGEMLVHGKRLAEIVKAMPADNVRLSTLGKDLLVHSGTSKIVVKAFDLVDAIPDRPISDAVPFKLPQKVLKGSLARTMAPARSAHAAVRSNLAGVRFDVNPDGVFIVSTDGRRAAVVRACDPIKCPPVGATIPIFSIDALYKVLGESGDVSVAIGESVCMFKTDGATIKTPILSESFAPYEKVMPSQSVKLFTVKRKQLIDAIHRAMIVGDQKMPCIKIDVMPGLMVIEASSSEGNAKEEVPVNDAYLQDAMVNPGYLLDALKVMSDDDISMTIDGTVYVTEGQYRSVIMPIAKKGGA